MIVRLRLPAQVAGLRKPGFLRDAATLATGTAAAQILVIASSPVLTRLYDPVDFGETAVFIALVAILLVTSSLRYETAIPIADSQERALSLLTLCLILTCVTSLCIAAALGMFGDAIFRVADASRLEPYMMLIPLTLLFAGAYQVIAQWAVRVAAFRRIARTRVAQSVALVTVQVGVGALSAGPAGLVLGQAVGQGTGGLTLGVATLRGSWSPTTETTATLRSVAGRYRRFPLFTMPASLMNTAGLFVPALLLAGTYGPRTAGYYALADRVVRLPTAVVADAMGKVYISRAARILRRPPQRIHALFLTTTRRLAAIALPLSLSIAIASWFGFPLIFGSQWETAGAYAAILAPTLAAQLVANPLSQTLNLLERQPKLFALDASRLVANVASILIPFTLGWPAAITLCVFSFTMVVFYGLYWLVSLRAT